MAIKREFPAFKGFLQLGKRTDAERFPIMGFAFFRIYVGLLTPGVAILISTPTKV